MLRVQGGGEGAVRGVRLTAPLQSIFQCLDASCWVAMETLQLWLMGGSSKVSREMGVVKEEGGEGKGSMFLVNVRC